MAATKRSPAMSFMTGRVARSERWRRPCRGACSAATRSVAGPNQVPKRRAGLEVDSIIARRPNVVDAPQQNAVAARKEKAEQERVRPRQRVRAPRHRHSASEGYRRPRVESRLRALLEPEPRDQNADDGLDVQQEVGERRVQERQRLRKTNGAERAPQDGARRDRNPRLARHAPKPRAPATRNGAVSKKPSQCSCSTRMSASNTLTRRTRQNVSRPHIDAPEI